MRPPLPGPRGAPRREPTDMRLLALASEQIRLLGAKRLTVVSVADAAGMTHANVYRYFPSKLALVDAVVDAWLKALERRLVDIVDAPDPADDKLERFLVVLARTHRETLVDNPHLFETLREATVARRLVARRHATRIKGLIERIIEEGVSTGAFQPRDREVAPANVLDACFRFVHPVALAVEAETPQSQFDLRLATLVRLVLRGLATGAI